MKRKAIYGLLAEFETAEEVLNAAQNAHVAGYRALDAFSPMPVEGLAEAVGFERTGLPKLVLGGGIFGMCFGFMLQWYANVVSWRINVDGKPMNSWPAFIPITFEMTILFAAVTATIGMLALNRLPTPYHPLFNVPRFAMATRTRFFLVIKSRDPMFSLTSTREFLETQHPYSIYEVEV